MPSFCFAEDDGIIGVNLGLDFYSRIDDAGDGLAQGITKLRLKEKQTYGWLWCGVNWLSNERIDQKVLEELKSGDYSTIMTIAASKKVKVTTSELSLITQCLTQRYTEIEKAAHRDQRTYEAVGNIWLYTDGDISNSDYDILYDIERINGIIFKDKDEYAGARNATAKAITNMLSWRAIASLFPGIPTSSNQQVSSNQSVWIPSTNVNTVAATNTQTPTAAQTPTATPWSDICSTWWTVTPTWWTSVAPAEDLFADDPFADLSTALAGGWMSEGVVYAPVWTQWNVSGVATSNLNFGWSEKKDFFNKLPCEDIFCITINMRKGNMNMLWGSRRSIEWLLESHIEMMDPISWSDLSQQKMTNNFYQLPFLNIKFKDKIAGARLFITDAPQVKKTVEKEATQEMADAKFELDLKCAMNEAGLPGDLNLVNWFIGAWYAPTYGITTENIVSTMIPLWPQEMENLAGCYDIRMWQGKQEADKWLATDINEIQAFSNAMTVIIQQILQADKKLDKLPSK